jgi:peptide/nickel transport system substrate-binding protein
VALNVTGTAIDDPDARLFEGYRCGSQQSSGYCSEEVDRPWSSGRTLDRPRLALSTRVEAKKLLADAALRLLGWGKLHWAHWAHVKGWILHENSIYNVSRRQDVWLDK